MSNGDYSIIEFFGSDDGHRCGYCKTSSGSRTDGMWAHSLTVKDYQDLIDRGWRRSGCYCYKPIMDSTCCPQYTIKCAALDFRLSKSQKKVMKRLNKFLAEGLQKKEPCGRSDTASGENEGAEEGCVDLPDLSEKAQANLTEDTKVESFEAILQGVNKGKKEKNQALQQKTSPSATKTSSNPPPDAGSSHPPCKKAKVMRRERRLEKLRKKGLDPEEVPAKSSQPVKSLEQLLQTPANPKHYLELRLVKSCPPSEEFMRTKAQSFTVYRKYQMIIHNDPPEKVTEKQFTRFLVNSPLEPYEGAGVNLGSYHQQYWLDGQLIAVGVIDLLPSCVSSVYFYYDPDFCHLSLGTYAALREIALTRELQRQEPALQFYYMGFYIHSCTKMRYKGQFNPSLLLCPSNFSWHSLEKCRPLLDASKYCVFSEERANADKVDLDKVLVLHRRSAMPFRVYAARNQLTAQKEADEVRCYAKLVGPDCASRMLLVRS